MALTKISTPGIKDEAITLAKLLHGDSNSDGTSMYPGAYMVGKKHYPTYNDALNDTNGTTCASP